MPRFLAKIGNFFWSRLFLKIILGLALLLVLLYIEEDWRGTHQWALTKAKWEAQGESFDPKKFIPPPVPDDQNLAALPLFKLDEEPGLDGRNYLSAVILRHALRSDSSLYYHTTGLWTNGELPDMAVIRKDLAAFYALAAKNAQPPNDLLAQFNIIYPFYTDFISACATRPFFRLNLDYATDPPVARQFGPITTPISLTRILALHANIAIDQHQPGLALADIKTNLAMVAGVGRDPSLVGGLVALGVAAINNGAIYDGLAQHAWNDAQLTDLEKALQPIDLFAGYQFSMRAEALHGIGNLAFFQHSNHSELERIFGRSVNESPVFNLIGLPWPIGWWDNNKCLITDFDFQLANSVDPQARLWFPRQVDQLKANALQADATWDAWAPWKILGVVSVGSIANAAEKFAEGQVWIDQTRIAIALERYHLAHNAYPDSLDALSPAYLDAVPHDPMSGKAYRYALRADGTFLLYSVGWNQVDDGGTVAYMNDNPKSIDYDNGDWVWPTPAQER